MTWAPDVTGRAVDLVDPVPEQVDFTAIAHAMANVNRYAGAPMQPCSVGLHTLIGLDLCPEPLKPHWLLHDAATARLGDVIAPVQDALATIADQGQAGFGQIVRRTLAEATRRHDVVIHAAAGLPMPSSSQRAEIRSLEDRCVATERRDFMAERQERPWRVELSGVQPAKRLRKWMPPDRVGEHLLDRFRLHLPALRAAF